jgi:hypothetical protein
VRNFKPAFLGDGWFDWIGTSPGRIDPDSGEFVDTTATGFGEEGGIFDFAEVTPGRVDPKTGMLIIPSNLSPEQREKLKRLHAERREAPSERSFSRFARHEGPSEAPRTSMRVRMEEEPREAQAASVFDKMFGAPAPRMNGPRVGCGTCGEHESYLSGSSDGGPGIALWGLFLGTVGVIALEAFGVTNWSQAKK